MGASDHVYPTDSRSAFLIGTLTLFGLNMPWLLVLCVLSWFLLLGVRRVLGAVGFYRWVWHPALFDTALFVVLLLVASQLSALIGSAP